MHDRIQAFARGRIVKNDLGEGGAVEAAHANDRRPHAPDLAQRVAAGCDSFAREFIRVDDVRAECFHAARDLALAGSDSAGQADSDGSPSGGGSAGTSSSVSGSSGTSIFSISSGGMSATC